MASIKELSAAKYQLISAEIKESKDGKTKYVVADFARAGLDKLMAAQENSIRLQILPKYGIAEDAANAYL
jgi:predicted metal-dependent phosphoesterase TrpH